MFANAFQSGFISIFYSVGSAPLAIWNKEVKNGHIRRIVDEEVKSLVLEISGSNVATTYITCPQKPRVSLAIKLPFLVMIIKNMKKYFTFEIQILDDKDIRRRFRVSNFQSTTKVRPFCTTMPIGLSDGWNQVQFNLADFTKRAYGSTYLETVRVQVHANVRIRRIYFSDTLYSEDEMPNEFRLFLPSAANKVSTAAKIKDKGKADKKEPAKPAPEEVPSGAPPSPAEPASLVQAPVVEEVHLAALIEEEPLKTEPEVEIITTEEVPQEPPQEEQLGKVASVPATSISKHSVKAEEGVEVPPDFEGEVPPAETAPPEEEPVEGPNTVDLPTEEAAVNSDVPAEEPEKIAVPEEEVQTEPAAEEDK